MNTLIIFCLGFSIAAFVYAYRAYKLVKRSFAIIEAKKTRTVMIDTGDDNITVIREEYDTDSERSFVRE